jgi:mannan endo-1,4-beta-mannosidase
VSRPSYNTGTGLFVLGNKLYDANGHEFVIRGVNKLHWDSASPGIVKTNANAVRWVIDFSQPTATNLNLMQGTIDGHMVPIPGNWGSGSCPPESQLPGIVDTWIAQKSAWLTIDSKMILNIANELGGGNSTAWRDAYITAIGRLRAAGYLCPIMVDAGGCGQDNDDLANYAQAILDSDPQKNVIFSQHIYGNWSSNNTQYTIDLTTGLDRLAATGLCIVIGEFGPGRNIGPSPTLITPAEIITGADARNFGWLAWAWDDPAYNADDGWFAMSYTGDYNSSADLTIFGKDVVENSTYGLKVKAVKQTGF